MTLNEAQLREIMSRPAIKRCNPVGIESSGASVQEPQKSIWTKVVHRQIREAADEPNNHRYRVTINLRYSTKRRRDIDGAATTILDALVAARRRLLDNYFRANRDIGTGGD